MKAKTKKHIKRVHASVKKHLKRATHIVAKRHVKRVVHVLTRKKVFRKKKTARTVLRSFLIGLATLSFGSLAYAITMNKPTVSVAVKNGSSLEIKAVPSAAAKPVFVNNGNTGKASWYALGLPAPDTLTCASRVYPRGTFLFVRNLRNQKTVICRVNDYGPEAWTGRIIDLSRGSFREIDSLSSGVTVVEVKQVAGPTGTQYNLPIETEIFNAVVGYNSCKTTHTAAYCDEHRQD
jgi:rare lipoprotein A (peptidoglycan hydrolase)